MVTVVMMEEQLQGENGWKYCAHGDKFWDCPHCSDEWNEGFL